MQQVKPEYREALRKASRNLTKSTLIVKHKSRSGKVSIAVLGAHTYRHTRWFVNVTDATGHSDIYSFVNVDLQAALDFANETWAD